MRLLELVPCGRPAAPQEEPKREPAPPPAALEKRRRRAAPGAGAQWRPSLGAISEDASAARSLERAARPAKAKAATRRVIPRADRDDFRQVGVPPVVPAFAPTAFLF